MAVLYFENVASTMLENVCCVSNKKINKPKEIFSKRLHSYYNEAGNHSCTNDLKCMPLTRSAAEYILLRNVKSRNKII